MIQRIRKYWSLSRWPMCLLGAWSVLLSAWIAQGNFQLTFRGFLVAFGMAVLIAGTMINNDYWDQDIDLKKGKKASNLKLSEGIWIILAGTVFIHLGLPLKLTFHQNLVYLLTLVIAYYLLITHSLTKKRFTFIPPLVVALWSTVPIFAGAYTAGSILPVHWLLAGFIFFIITAREIIKDIEDIEIDFTIRPTIPIELGTPAAIKISIIAIITAINVAFCLIKVNHNKIFTIATGFSLMPLIITIFVIYFWKNNLKSPTISATLLAISLWLEVLACHLLV